MTRMIIKELQPRAIERAGYIPGFLDPDDPRPVKDQINDSYKHGGGWRPFEGVKLDPTTRKLRYPGDPPMTPYLEIRFGDELVLIYPFGWVMIQQPDGTYEVAKVD